jgi:hypothetical protein
LFRRPKFTLSCSAEKKEGRKEGRKDLYKILLRRIVLAPNTSTSLQTTT